MFIVNLFSTSYDILDYKGSLFFEWCLVYFKNHAKSSKIKFTIKIWIVF